MFCNRKHLRKPRNGEEMTNLERKECFHDWIATPFIEQRHCSKCNVTEPNITDITEELHQEREKRIALESELKAEREKVAEANKMIETYYFSGVRNTSKILDLESLLQEAVSLLNKVVENLRYDDSTKEEYETIDSIFKFLESQRKDK